MSKEVFFWRIPSYTQGAHIAQNAEGFEIRDLASATQGDAIRLIGVLEGRWCTLVQLNLMRGTASSFPACWL